MLDADLGHCRTKVHEARIHLATVATQDIPERFPCWTHRKETLECLKAVTEIAEALLIEVDALRERVNKAVGEPEGGNA